MVVFQKLEGKTTTLKFWNQKVEGKTTTLNFWNQKLEGKTTTLKNWIKRMEGNSTTPKNCRLTIFLYERSTIFSLVFSLRRFWILLRNDICTGFERVFFKFVMCFADFITISSLTIKGSNNKLFSYPFKVLWIILLNNLYLLQRHQLLVKTFQ